MSVETMRRHLAYLRELNASPEAIASAERAIREAETNLPFIDPETDDTMGQTIPITQSRLFDLVRFKRGELLDDGLISLGEWTWLTTCATPDIPGAGSPSRKRLEEYDELRARLEKAEQDLAEAQAQVRQFIAAEIR